MKFGMVLALTAVVGAVAMGEDWPQFRGPRADGISREKGINKNWTKRPPKQLWKVPVGDEGYAGPAVANGKVFYIDHQGSEDVVRALRLSDGKEVWKYAYADADQPLYGYSRATPTVHDGKVYTCSRKGNVNCLDEKTGALVWTKNIVTDLKGSLPYQWDASASLPIDGDKVFVVTGAKDKPLAALDRLTGATVWEGGAPDASTHSTPVVATVDGKKQVLVLFGSKLQGIDIETGAGLWSFPWLSVNIPEPLVVGPNLVLVTTDYQKQGSALVNVENGVAKKMWEKSELKCYFNTPVLVGGYLYGATGGQKPGLSCVNASTGDVKWSQPGFANGGVVAVDGTLIAVDASNGDITMVALTPTAFKPLGKIKGLGRKDTWTPPIIANGKLIVRDTKNMACYDLK